MMGCKLSISVIHPESIVNKIKKSISPKQIIKKPSQVKPKDPTPPASPESTDTYETIYLDSP
tara:strand:+ start:556 stop:741 length:186 start_codon:yes stop_codon:yes gene_type:complete